MLMRLIGNYFFKVSLFYSHILIPVEIPVEIKYCDRCSCGLSLSNK